MKSFFIGFIVFFILSPQLAAHKEWVHQYIVQQAYDLLVLYFDRSIPEIENHLGGLGPGTGPWDSGEILKGAYREDIEDVVTGVGGFGNGWSASSTHFWDVDNGDLGNNPITAI